MIVGKLIYWHKNKNGATNCAKVVSLTKAEIKMIQRGRRAKKGG